MIGGGIAMLQHQEKGTEAATASPTVPQEKV